MNESINHNRNSESLFYGIKSNSMKMVEERLCSASLTNDSI